jgi:hypothetical protein
LLSRVSTHAKKGGGELEQRIFLGSRRHTERFERLTVKVTRQNDVRDGAEAEER